MQKTKFWIRTIALTYTLTTVLINSSVYASTEPNVIQFVPPPPPDTGEPTGRVQGGGSRGNCRNDRSLMALVPVTKTAEKSYVWGLTTAEHPTLMFYVPERTTAETVEFVLQDESDNEIYTTRFTLTKTVSGIVRISLPATTSPLIIGKKYRWIFLMECDPQSPSNSVFVRGTIERVAIGATLLEQLKTTQTPLERATVYAANGIWYDALTSLSEQDNLNSPTIQTAWIDLLEQVGLAPMARTPIVWQTDD
ncbi:hypothetical protein C7H19_20405 [Aphanothece hegewaldii CCALA 016]|uniref:DUF928 domain-containing protein n=1 Tax=Aphanothece hegewaldii CCALA 016 TaxID=2107694 RepID=A0A2T1LSW4_9CHRO|nr:DUF928 domain-containing protein [Aphanothece hegewaldii]PSF33170.1 hypothetical protein C7H19_20405 [Aphanothece hegewaldii CCALA 016]